jgi:hypothetical protein
MYYIYHIKGVKIGVSEEPDNRTKKQGFDDYEILETNTCIYLVSYRERALQKEYGYPVDKVLYYEMVNISTFETRSKGGKIGGLKNVESGQFASLKTTEHQKKAGSAGGKIGGPITAKKNVESGHMSALGKSGKGPKISSNKKRICPYCGLESNGVGYFRYHGNNCKHKPTAI